MNPWDTDRAAIGAVPEPILPVPIEPEPARPRENVRESPGIEALRGEAAEATPALELAPERKLEATALDRTPAPAVAVTGRPGEVRSRSCMGREDAIEDREEIVEADEAVLRVAIEDARRLVRGPIARVDAAPEDDTWGLDRHGAATAEERAAGEPEEPWITLDEVAAGAWRLIEPAVDEAEPREIEGPIVREDWPIEGVIDRCDGAEGVTERLDWDAADEDGDEKNLGCDGAGEIDRGDADCGVEKLRGAGVEKDREVPENGCEDWVDGAEDLGVENDPLEGTEKDRVLGEGDEKDRGAGVEYDLDGAENDLEAPPPEKPPELKLLPPPEKPPEL